MLMKFLQAFRRILLPGGFLLFSGLPLAGQSPQITQPDSLAKSDTLHYTLDEVMVTGTRTEKKLIDIPYPVQRIDNRQFRFERKVSVSDVLGSVPGLFLQSRYGNHDVRISIRGFGSRSNSGIRGVRILLDGIPESEPDGQTRIEAIDFESIGKIEIVKGNASSLYTNAPGGVINFINDVQFPHSFASIFSHSGSFGLRRFGAKTGFRNQNYTFLATYSDHTTDGYRTHSNDQWKILNTVLESKPNDRSSLTVLGYFVDGFINLPGSLTLDEVREDPLQANQRDIDRDSKRISKKGRVGLRFNTFLDKDRRHRMELTTYGTIKYFERASGIYRIINRYGLGASGSYIYHSTIGGRKNEFSIGGDLLLQTGPIEFYQNINGDRSDILTGLTDETIGNSGAYFLNSYSLVPDKFDVLISGRYDRVIFDQKNQILAAQNARRTFEAFTPKIALNWKVRPSVAIYASAGRSFDSPAGNELDNYPTSSQPNGLINPDLKPQKSLNSEVGIKGYLPYRFTQFFNDIYFEATAFNYNIEDEIVPFEVFGEVFFRNSGKTNRRGLELGSQFEVVDGLRFEGAYTYSDFSYESYTARTIEIGNQGSLDVIDRDFSGNIVPSVPRHNLSGSLSLERKLATNVTAFIKGSYRGVSGIYVDDVNSAKSERYDIFNGNVGLDFQVGQVSVLASAGIYNMADKDHIAFININSAAQRFYEAGEPRHYFGSVKLGYKF